MIETMNKHSLLYQYGTFSEEESCVLMSQALFEHQEKEQQVSNQSQELNLNNSRGLHMHAQLNVSPKNQTENHEKSV